jgi:bacillithiol system protein YtxJ
MSIFDKIFGGKEEEIQTKSFWNKINTEEDLQQAIAESKNQKVAIFKHSTSCFISKTVLRNFEKEIENADKVDAKLYFLDLLAHRSISNKIAEILGVRHESPQLIVLENGAVKDHASHQAISLNLI